MFEASLGPAQHHQNLTIFPVIAEEDRELPFQLLADALASGILTIGEKNGGEVPLLLAQNQGLAPVLILDGEQLIGAKQNRMTNRSILLPPQSITEIPVSCMEQGRWHHVSENFSPAPQHAPTKVRRKARETEVRASYDAESAPRDRARGPGGRASGRTSHRDLAAAQGDVWNEIREMEDKLGHRSDTGAMDTLYESRRPQMRNWIREYPLVERQIGLVAFMGEVPLGMDAVGSPALFERIRERILTGYVMDALEWWMPGGRLQPVAAKTAERFVASVITSDRIESDSVGMGEYRILRGEVLGGELIERKQVVHLSAFPTLDRRQNGSGNGNGGGHGPLSDPPIAPPSSRRRRF